MTATITNYEDFSQVSFRCLGDRLSITGLFRSMSDESQVFFQYHSLVISINYLSLRKEIVRQNFVVPGGSSLGPIDSKS